MNGTRVFRANEPPRKEKKWGRYSMISGRKISCSSYHFKHNRYSKEYSEGVVYKPGPTNQSVCNVKVNKIDGGMVGLHA
jgi:hypothetical protein